MVVPRQLRLWGYDGETVISADPRLYQFLDQPKAEEVGHRFGNLWLMSCIRRLLFVLSVVHAPYCGLCWTWIHHSLVPKPKSLWTEILLSRLLLKYKYKFFRTKAAQLTQMWPWIPIKIPWNIPCDGRMNEQKDKQQKDPNVFWGWSYLQTKLKTVFFKHLKLKISCCCNIRLNFKLSSGLKQCLKFAQFLFCWGAAR